MEELRGGRASAWRSGSNGRFRRGSAGSTAWPTAWSTAGAITAYLVGSVQPLLSFLATHPVVSMLVEEPDLEEAFLDLYQEAS